MNRIMHRLLPALAVVCLASAPTATATAQPAAAPEHTAPAAVSAPAAPGKIAIQPGDGNPAGEANCTRIRALASGWEFVNCDDYGHKIRIRVISGHGPQKCVAPHSSWFVENDYNNWDMVDDGPC
ncbi:hypothetical protein D5S17_35595 [Pseudonocardiaceae bacterium YIM PH 21723]|nr:hypothetical protein D5S17_35595 [Pseudonocardiaceae bacterium YIM PH 21723]